MKEIIQEDLNNFKSLIAPKIMWLKKWWVRLILSGAIGCLFDIQRELKRDINAPFWGIVFFFFSYVALYFLVVWMYGRDKNK